MEMRTLRYFVTVAEELNITHAAEKLNMSQPPLSTQIKSLEDELGVPLFVRGKRHLQLTEAGTVFYRRALEILALTEKSSQEISMMGNGLSGKISLGLVEGRPPFLVAHWLKGFREEYPMVRFSLWNGSGDDVIDRLNKGILDLAVIAAPYDNEHLDGFEVGREPWVAILNRSDPLAQTESPTIPLRMLKDSPLIIPARKSRQEAILNWFQGQGIEPHILCEMSNYLDAVALTEQGIGISIFPQTTYTPNDLIVSKVITQPERQARYYLIWNKHQRFSVLMESFIYYVKDMAEEEGHSPLFEKLSVQEYVPSDKIPIL